MARQSKRPASEMPNRIRQLREERGWKPPYLGRLIGRTSTQIHRLEGGGENTRQDALTPEYALKLAAAFGCDVGQLLWETAETTHEVNKLSHEQKLDMLIQTANTLDPSELDSVLEFCLRTGQRSPGRFLRALVASNPPKPSKSTK